MGTYRDLTSYLRQKGLPVIDVCPTLTLGELLALCSGTYLTGGLKSLREIPSASVDFVFSHASLQQVRRREFLPVMQELRRIQKPDGAGSYSVSMRDLIGGAANDMRFSMRAWESPLMSEAGFYTNRLRYSQMLGIFKQAGFEIEVRHVGKWGDLPLRREDLASEFRKLSDDDLRIYEWDVLLH
jgi:SAM-dependent methyltransferase